MSRRITSITPDMLRSLPERCRSCVYWESLTRQWGGYDSSSLNGGKEEWFKDTLSEWGTCGRLLFRNGNVLAYTQYAPQKYFPQIRTYPQAPISEDAIFLSCLYVAPEVRDRGLGKLMLSSVVKDLYKRKYKALETFASKAPGEHPSGPIEFYLEQGFRIVKDDPEYPLLRLEFASIVSWQENLEKALARLKLPVRAKAPLPL